MRNDRVQLFAAAMLQTLRASLIGAAAEPEAVTRFHRPRLQIINGGNSPIDVFWLKTPDERVSNGSVEPGKHTVITTTLGHRFAIINREDKSESLVASEVLVQAFHFGGVPAIYTQRASAEGFPVVASDRVNRRVVQGGLRRHGIPLYQASHAPHRPSRGLRPVHRPKVRVSRKTEGSQKQDPGGS